MNILYLTFTRFNEAPYRDASTRYRCFHFAEDFRAIGHNADITSIDSLTIEQLPYYDVVCVLRPTASQRLYKILDTCQALGILTLADFDDLLFSPEHAERAPAVLSQQAGVRPMRMKFQQHLDALRHFSQVTVATQSLLHHVQRLHPGALVTRIPNGLSQYWIDANRYLDVESPDGKLQDGQTEVRPSTITYLPGSRSHNADFSHIADTLAAFFAGHPELTLHIVGELDFDARAFKPNQLRRSSWMDYTRLPTLTKSSLATIAPLEDSEFNLCKSHIKFIESAAFGTPVIMSAIPDVVRHQPMGGLKVVNNTEDWTAALLQVVEESLTSTIRDDLQSYARTHCMNHNSLSKLLTFMGYESTRKAHDNNNSYATAR